MNEMNRIGYLWNDDHFRLISNGISSVSSSLSSTGLGTELRLQQLRPVPLSAVVWGVSATAKWGINGWTKKGKSIGNQPDFPMKIMGIFLLH